MTNIGESLTEEESEDFIKMIDADGDGLVNYQELMKILSSKEWTLTNMNINYTF